MPTNEEQEVTRERGDGEARFTGPVVNSALFDIRTRQPQERVEQYVSSEASKAAHRISGWMARQLEAAYMDGLHDGFAQGVASAHFNAEEPSR